MKDHQARSQEAWDSMQRAVEALNSEYIALMQRCGVKRFMLYGW